MRQIREMNIDRPGKADNNFFLQFWNIMPEMINNTIWLKWNMFLIEVSETYLF